MSWSIFALVINIIIAELVVIDGIIIAINFVIITG